MDPVLSVVIPIYGVEKYIEECLGSVLCQDVPEMEILCIDDASPDHSAQIAEATAKKDSRIRVIRTGENRGLSAGRNRGLDEARGKYIYFLDGDDKIEEGAFAQTLVKMSAEKLDAMVFGARFIFENDSFREKFESNPAVFKQEYSGVYDGKDLLVSWMNAWDWMPSQPRWFYDRGFLVRSGIRYREGLLHEDEMFTLDVLMQAGRVAVEQERWFIRRFRSGSIMTRKPGFPNIEACMHILSAASAWSVKYRDEKRIADALKIYRGKIAANVKNKFAEAGGKGEFRVSENGPMISAVIPVYNTAPYLEECLESLIAQDFADMEIIAVDDGSTDGSEKILARYAELDPRIKIITCPENRGQAVARNLGIDAAAGRYVYMMDSDDLLKAGALARLFSVCEESGADFAGFENEQFTDLPEFRETADAVLFTYEKTQGVYTGREAFITCVMNDTLSPSVPTFFIRRELLSGGKIRFTEGILHEDIGFIFLLFMKAQRAVFLHEAFYRRRFRSNSTVTSGFSAIRAQGYLSSWRAAYECEAYIDKKYGDDAGFLRAVRKWKRDVLGRIRVLYMENEEALYSGQRAVLNEETALLFDMMREVNTGRARAADILGPETCAELEADKNVYICGAGQYAQRIAAAAGALDVRILGFIMSPEERRGRRAFLGFPVYLPEEIEDRETRVLLAVSHYSAESRRAMLRDARISNITEVSF